MGTVERSWAEYRTSATLCLKDYNGSIFQQPPFLWSIQFLWGTISVLYFASVIFSLLSPDLSSAFAEAMSINHLLIWSWMAFITSVSMLSLIPLKGWPKHWRSSLLLVLDELWKVILSQGFQNLSLPYTTHPSLVPDTEGQEEISWGKFWAFTILSPFSRRSRILNLKFNNLAGLKKRFESGGKVPWGQVIP